MKTEFTPKELSSRMLAVITGGLGLVMMAVAVTLWQLFDLNWAASVTFVYGCFLLLTAFYIWRNRCRFTEKTQCMGY